MLKSTPANSSSTMLASSVVKILTEKVDTEGGTDCEIMVILQCLQCSFGRGLYICGHGASVQ